MTILNFKIDNIGQSGVHPKIIYIDTDDPVSTVIQQGYLDFFVLNNDVEFSGNDMALVNTKESVSSRIQTQWYKIDKNSVGSITLIETPKTIDPILPTTTNHIAFYTDTRGTLSEDPALGLTGGFIQAIGDVSSGDDTGTAGEFISYPNLTTKGNLSLSAQQNAGNYNVIISNEEHQQNTTYKIGDCGSSSGSFLVTDIVAADPNINIIEFSVTATADLLRNGGFIVLQEANSSTSSYLLNDVYVNFGGTAFSGASGERSISIKDTAGLIHTLIGIPILTNPGNYRWGEANFTLSNVNRASTPGEDIIITYETGGNDWANGSVLLTGTLIKLS